MSYDSEATVRSITSPALAPAAGKYFDAFVALDVERAVINGDLETARAAISARNARRWELTDMHATSDERKPR